MFVTGKWAFISKVYVTGVPQVLTVPWFGQLVVGFSLRRAGFNAGLVGVGFVADRVGLVFLSHYHSTNALYLHVVD
jgi:hypothetical protein